MKISEVICHVFLFWRDVKSLEFCTPCHRINHPFLYKPLRETLMHNSLVLNKWVSVVVPDFFSNCFLIQG